MSPMEKPIRSLGRELLSNSWISQTNLRPATGLSFRKISGLLRRLELFLFVEVEKEPHFTRVRPKKIYRLTSGGIEYFTGLLGASPSRRHA